MFNRKAYKEYAKKSLKGRWKTPVLISIIIILITVLAGIPFDPQKVDSCIPWPLSLIPMIFSAILSVAFISYVFALICTTEEVPFSKFIEGLNNWYNALLSSLWNLLWVTLWSCLFVVPGIVKAISYSQMFFIIAENPKIGARKAMQLSKIITQGHKGDLFTMGLSFLGWFCLAALTAGIGLLWLSPYVTVSFANAYYDLKQSAIHEGKLQFSDFEELV